MAIGVLSKGDDVKAQEIAAAMAPLPGEDFGDVMYRVYIDPETRELYNEIKFTANAIGAGFNDAGEQLGL